MAVSPVLGRNFGAWVCKKMGLDPNQVAKITIVADPQQLVEVEIVFIATTELAEAIVRKYVLVDIGGDE